MKRSEITVMPGYFDRYIMLPEDIDIVEALEKYTFKEVFDLAKLKALGDRVYAENKWTVRDILQHAIDTERIMTYRALRFARNDKTSLQGFEEDDYGKEARATRRTIDDLLEESEYLRRSNIALFKSFTDEILLREGVASGQNISVLALGFVIAGHPVHHANVIRERYYPLLS